MPDENLIVVLRLEGALQSWGEDSHWNHRDTGEFPTKSGILGMLGCALGLEKGDQALIELEQAFTMAVRADRAGTRLVDFHTVTGSPLLTADGKPRSVGNTFISRRDYLQDACFTVFLQIDPKWRGRVKEALKNPIWPIYLGRKNCIPSKPVFMEETVEYASLIDAVFHYQPDARAVKPMAFEIEDRDDSLVSLSRPDKMVSADRAFALRSVWRGTVKEEENVPVKD